MGLYPWFSVTNGFIYGMCYMLRQMNLIVLNLMANFDWTLLDASGNMAM